MATSGPATTWVNKDGLLVRFGPTESVPGTVGSFEDHLGGQELFEARVDFGTDVATNGQIVGTATTGVGALLDPNGTFTIPNTAVIEKVEIFVVKALAGGTSLSMGLLNPSTFLTIAGGTTHDLLNAETQTNLGTTGRRWIYTVSGGFLDGAPGTTSANGGSALGVPPGGAGSAVVAMPSVWTVGTFTAGRLQIRIYLSYSARDAVLT